MERPIFENIKDYQEFSKYYWYREELKQICKKIGVANTGTKQELNYYIEQYYNGNIIKIILKIKKKERQSHAKKLLRS